MGTRGILYNGTKYLYLINDNTLKQKSLEDNIYFTLRDIFTNIDDFQFAMEANIINDQLTNGILYQERTEDFSYSTILMNDLSFIDKLKRWLSSICEYYFDFEEVEEDIDLDNYLLWEVWILQLQELIKVLEEKIHHIMQK
jgi:hypothetical protein